MKLIDIEKLATQYPGIQPPPRHERDQLRPGDYARVIVATPDPADPAAEVLERVWLRIQTTGPRFVGTVVAHPVCVPDLAADGVVEFRHRHIFETAHPNPIRIAS